MLIRDNYGLVVLIGILITAPANRLLKYFISFVPSNGHIITIKYYLRFRIITYYTNAAPNVIHPYINADNIDIYNIQCNMFFFNLIIFSPNI